VSAPGFIHTNAARWMTAAVLLLGLAWWVDLQALLVRLLTIDPAMVALALSVTVVQVVLSAWRWRYTAGRLGLSLSGRRAVSEYYLATLVNQVLPGGVLGDVGRAWRHSQRSENRLAAANAVVIERFSGQVALMLVTIGLLWFCWPFGPGGLVSPVVADEAEAASATNTGAFWLSGLAVVLVVGFVLRRTLLRFARALGRESVQALFSWPAFPVQLFSSVTVVATYLLVFTLLAVGLGLEGGPLIWLPLCAGLLLAMVVPVTVAGWGVREGAAAALWAAAGLPPEEGVLLGVAYGVVILVSALPGLVVVLRPRPAP